jgi:hypothetical protein
MFTYVKNFNLNLSQNPHSTLDKSLQMILNTLDFSAVARLRVKHQLHGAADFLSWHTGYRATT